LRNDSSCGCENNFSNMNVMIKYEKHRKLEKREYKQISNMTKYFFLINSSYGVDECSAICNSPSATTYANLSGCTLTFTGSVPSVWYAFALQVNYILFKLFLYI
jgi:hypothetical protein